VTGERLTYAVVTPVKNEAENLRRVAASLLSQTVLPAAWVIVDTGSEDETEAVARPLVDRYDWVEILSASDSYARGGPIVRAFQAGVASLRDPVDVVVKLDADLSFDPRYFEELLQRFAADSKLGIASGSCLEEEAGEWRERHVTGDHVWGACRAYRSRCLAEVSPLEERMGWDGIDAFKAKAGGWHTATFHDLAFRHHRREGARDGRWEAWSARGRAAHYMGYRPMFLIIRATNRLREDPAAVGMIVGWARAAIAREPRCPDARARAELRRQQRLRELPARILESIGRRPERRASA
jgi:glycosyltransferase involved in cell wall biosynthesis